MPWNNKNVDTQELIKEAFGMTAEEVKAQLAKVSSLETLVNDVKGLATAQTTTLAEMSESLKKVSTPYSTRTEHTVPPTNTPTELREWHEDANGAWEDRSKPLIGAILDTRSMIAKREAIDEINASNPDLPFQKLAKQIEEKTKDSPLEWKANPVYWKNVYYAVVGENRQEIERDKTAKTGKFFTETGSSSIVVSDTDNVKPEDKLSPSQLEAARKSGLSPAVYAKELESMTLVR